MGVSNFMVGLFPRVMMCFMMMIIVEDCFIGVSVSCIMDMAFLGMGGVVMVMHMGGGVLTMDYCFGICVLYSSVLMLVVMLLSIMTM